MLTPMELLYWILNGENLVAYVTLGLPQINTVIKALGTKARNGTIESIEMVGSNEKLSWSQKADALIIKPSKNYPSENAVVYKIIFKK